MEVAWFSFAWENFSNSGTCTPGRILEFLYHQSNEQRAVCEENPSKYKEPRVQTLFRMRLTVNEKSIDTQLSR